MKRENIVVVIIIAIAIIVVALIIRNYPWGNSADDVNQDISTTTVTTTIISVTSSTILNISSKSALGQFLTDANGMTLYYFKNDTKGSNRSVCVGQCSTLWPAFSSLNIMVNAPLKQGDISSFIRGDNNTEQIAYQGWPLYYYYLDKKPGDTFGHGVGGVWSVISPNVASTSISTTSAGTIPGSL